MKHRIMGGFLFISGLLVLLTPRFILPVCEYYDHPRMACSYTGFSEVFLGVIIMSSSVGMFFSRQNESLRWLMFITFVTGLSVILVPEVLGYCRNDRMPCNYGTVPALRLEGIAVCAVSLIGFVLSFKKESLSEGR